MWKLFPLVGGGRVTRSTSCLSVCNYFILGRAILPSLLFITKQKKKLEKIGLTQRAPWAFVQTGQPWGLSNSQSCLNRLFAERYQVVINPCAVWRVVWFSYLKRVGGEEGLCTFNFKLFFAKAKHYFLFSFAVVFLLGSFTLLKFNCQAGLALPHAVCVGCLSGSALEATRQRRGQTVFFPSIEEGEGNPRAAEKHRHNLWLFFCSPLILFSADGGSFFSCSKCLPLGLQETCMVMCFRK